MRGFRSPGHFIRLYVNTADRRQRRQQIPRAMVGSSCLWLARRLYVNTAAAFAGLPGIPNSSRGLAWPSPLPASASPSASYLRRFCLVRLRPLPSYPGSGVASVSFARARHPHHRLHAVTEFARGLDIDMASPRSLLRHQRCACTRGLRRPSRPSRSARWLYIDSVTVIRLGVSRVRAYLGALCIRARLRATGRIRGVAATDGCGIAAE